MKGRRIAALLCVLLAHALIIFSVIHMQRPVAREAAEDPSVYSEPVTVYLNPLLAPSDPVTVSSSTAISTTAQRRPAAAPSTASAAAAAAPAGTPDVTPQERIDWPLEGKKAATRVLAREAEAERIARMFSGPGGTWASLTKREKSRLKKFRWKPGVDGLEYDANGNAIYHISDGCVLVNFMYIGCALGKATVHGDLFKDMRLYFDEQRLPPTNDGNGTEPESMRDPNAPRSVEGAPGPFSPPPPPEGH
jgi:hypothetical protein